MIQARIIFKGLHAIWYYYTLDFILRRNTMLQKVRVNTERIRFIGYLFFAQDGKTKGLDLALRKYHDKGNFKRLWYGTEPCLNYHASMIRLGFSGNFIITPYPPEIGSLKNKEALNVQGIGIPNRPFSSDPLENFEWKDKFLNLSAGEQINRIDAYCFDIRQFRADPNNQNKVDLSILPNPPSQATIDKLVDEFHFEISSRERRDRIVEWFSYQHPY